jgi:sugar phosphate isomerase/epimerase
MEFGIVASCFADYPWKSFLDAAWRMGAEAVELDTRPTAHCSTLLPERDPGAVVAELKEFSLRAGAVAAYQDLVQPDPNALQQEVEGVCDLLDLAFHYRAEVVRLAPPRPKVGLSREEMLTSYREGCRQVAAHAEQTGMLLCLHHDPEVLRDADTLLALIEDAGSYNLKVSLDVFELLCALHDEEAVRREVIRLAPHTAHVVLRDGRVNRHSGAVTETAIGEGDCPVELVVSELLGLSFYRPFYVAYTGGDDVAEMCKKGIDYFRDLPNRLLEEAGML